MLQLSKNRLHSLVYIQLLCSFLDPFSVHNLCGSLFLIQCVLSFTFLCLCQSLCMPAYVSLCLSESPREPSSCSALSLSLCPLLHPCMSSCLIICQLTRLDVLMVQMFTCCIRGSGFRPQPTIFQRHKKIQVECCSEDMLNWLYLVLVSMMGKKNIPYME